MQKTLLSTALLMAFSVNALAVSSIGSINIDGLAAEEAQLGNDKNKTVVITSNEKDRAVLVQNSSEKFEIRGQDITISTSEHYENIRAETGASLVIGGSETEKVTLTAKKGDGLVALPGSKDGSATSINLTTKELMIDVSGAGIWAQNNTEDATAPNKHTTININANKTTIKAGSIGIAAFSNSEINLSGDVSIDAPEAIEARGNSTVNINQDGKSRVNIKGDIVFATPGNNDNSGSNLNANVNINLSGAESSWTGSVIYSYPEYFDGEQGKDEWKDIHGFKLSLKDGAVWTPTHTERIEKPEETDTNKWTQITDGRALNNLHLDGGVVNVTGDDIDVTVEKMTGTGTINLATDGTTAGKFNVKAADEKASLNVNLMDTKLEKQLTADEINAEQAKKLMANVGGTDGKNVVSTSTAVPEGMVNPAFGVDAEGKTHEASANTLMQSSLELASAAPLALNRIMMNDVRKRLGDIRTTEGTHGAWARYDGGKLSGEGGLENDFHTVQVGIDTVPTADSARMGVAFSYTDSDAEYARGSADMKAYSIAMYGTKVFDNGMFVDVIGRMGTADSDLTVDGQHKGTLDNVVLGVSGEFGWRFDVTNSMYIEPQAELSYAYVNGDKLTLGTAEYEVDSVNSLLGRVGFAAGLKCPSDMGNVYVRASAVHEFLGDSKITGANASHTNVYEIDGKDTWVEYGLGANFNVTKSTYMWADVERTSGGALDEDWRATVGVRYAW